MFGPEASGEAGPTRWDDPSLDWPQILRLARRHHLLPAAIRAFQAGPGDPPTEVAETIKLWWKSHVLACEWIEQQLKLILGAAEEKGIAVIPLKGTYLARRLYGEAEARQVSDLDVLVRPADVVTADRQLEALGYRRECRLPIEQLARGNKDIWYTKRITSAYTLFLELHQDLVPYANGRSAWGSQAVWESARKSRVEGAGYWELAGVDEGCYLAINHVTHGLARLGNLADFLAALSLPGAPTWKTLAARLGAFGLEQILYWVRWQCEELLGERIELKEGEAMAPWRWRRRMTAWWLRRNGRPPAYRRDEGPYVSLLWWLMMRRFSDQWRVAKNILFPPRAVLTQMYGLHRLRQVYPYYVVRGWQRMASPRRARP
jgi:hypothetical protein